MTDNEAIGNLIHAVRWNDMPEKEALHMAIKAEKQIKRIKNFLNVLDLDDITYVEFEEMFMKQPINDIRDELWKMYCFAEDVCNTLNM